MKNNGNVFPMLIGVILLLFMVFPDLLNEPDYEKPVALVLATSTPTIEPTIDPLLIAAIQRSESAPTLQGDNNAMIILGNAAGAMHVCKGDNVHDCESVTLFFSNGVMDALWTREINPTDGAILLGITTSSDDGMFVAIASEEPNGLQKIHLINSSFMVTNTLMLDPAEYGFIESISGLTVTEYGELTNMIIVTDKGHFQFYIGNGRPSIDQTH